MPKKQIYVLIDPQKGFYEPNPTQQGGNFPSHNANAAIKNTAELLSTLQKNGNDEFIVLTQNYYPENHISFIDSHPGVQEYVKKTQGNAYNNYHDILIDGKTGTPVALAVQQEGKIRYFAVETKNSRITQVHADQEIDPKKYQNTIKQTLLPKHCIQNTHSAEFLDELRLPQSVTKTANESKAPWFKKKEGKMRYYVARKGQNSEVGSAGILHDNKVDTPLDHTHKIFEDIATKLQQQGVTEVDINVAGLASNLGVEPSIKDLTEAAEKIFKPRGIKASIIHMHDLSSGVPIKKADGTWPDLDQMSNRLKKQGPLQERSLEEIQAERQKDHILDPGPSRGTQAAAGISFGLLLIGSILLAAGIFTANPILMIAGGAVLGAGFVGMTSVGAIEGTRRAQLDHVTMNRELDGKGKGKGKEREGQGQEQTKGQDKAPAVKTEQTQDIETATPTRDNTSKQPERTQKTTSAPQQLRQVQHRSSKQTASATPHLQPSPPQKGEQVAPSFDISSLFGNSQKPNASKPQSTKPVQANKPTNPKPTQLVPNHQTEGHEAAVSISVSRGGGKGK